MELQIFQNSGFQIRGGLINNEPYFALVDICKILAIKNVSDAKDRLKKDGVVSSEVIDSLGRKQNATLINEQNLYKIIFQSRKEEAEQFQDWVTGEVLPSIRKHGIYATDTTIEKMISNPDFAIQLLTTLKEEKAARIEAERRNAVLMHATKTYTTTEIAKELGLKSAIALNNKLAEKKVQFKQNETWVLYSKYADLGYTDIKQSILDSGRIVYDRRWTQDGRAFILGLF